MGACTFQVSGRGKDATSVFNRLVEESQYESGHQYSGEIGMKGNFIMFTRIPRKTWQFTIDKLMDEETGDKRIDDKWGPAGCLDITKEVRKEGRIKLARGEKYFVFFGWASS